MFDISMIVRIRILGIPGRSFHDNYWIFVCWPHFC